MRVDRRSRLARIWSNHELRKIAPLITGDVVNVSAWDDRDKEGGRYVDYFCNARSYSKTNFSGDRGLEADSKSVYLDLTEDLPASMESRFDTVFNHTTLEHILHVDRAFQNLCRMTRDMLIVVVPFAQIQHESPSWKDYWRLTPSCLRALFADSGLETVYESESPQYDAAVYLFFVGSRTPEVWRSRLPVHQPVSEAGRWIGRHWSEALRVKAGRISRALRRR